MSELLQLLVAAVAAKSRDKTVALLLSGGLDSLSVGLALEKAGKIVRAYTYRLENYPSKDLKKAIAIAGHFGWPLTVITVPTTDVANDFLRLAVEHGCRKKVQFEVTFPMLYVFPQIDEAEVWTGWNADDHYGNTRECIFRQRRMAQQGLSLAERKLAFDAERCTRFEGPLTNPESGQTWWYAHRLASRHGKKFFDPYLDKPIRDHFLQFDHAQLSPFSKPLVREALAGPLERLPRGSVAVGVRLQIGGGVNSLFATILTDIRINRFDQKYTTVSALCQRWGHEVTRDREAFLAELRALSSPKSAEKKIICGLGRYQGYTMDGVRRASTQRKFTVVSMFAGGGGSCVGYRLAGGHVLLANEFVPEARRTYHSNFPDTPIDARDIREIIADPAAIEAFLAQVGLRPGVLDILDGSPPCCEFSTGHKARSDHSQLRSYSDVQQRNMDTLMFDFFQLAKAAQPKVVIAENIPALRSRHGGLFEAALHCLRFSSNSNPRTRAYYASAAVLSAADFGVAQDRRRLFVVGVRQDVAEAVGITGDSDVAALFPAPTHSPVSVRSALTGLQQSPAEIFLWRRAVMTAVLGRIVRHLPRNPQKCLTPRHVGFPKGLWFSLVRCAWDIPAPTLTVMGQRPDGLSGALHPDQDRKFSLPELKRLTGLPDNFVLTGSLGQAAERICRMVPPPLMQAIAERVYERVLKPYAEASR
jgi:DNA (cytosine-5)-methyltransferase 1